MDDSAPHYRDEALKKISSPEQLDQLIHVTNPKGWVALTGMLGLLLIILIWGIWGEMVTSHISPCILYSDMGGLRRLSTNQEGVVEKMQTQIGSEIVTDQPLFTLKSIIAPDSKATNPASSKFRLSTVTAPINGKIINYYVNQGQFLPIGKPYAVIQPWNSQSDGLIAHVFANSEDARQVKVGMEVLLAVDGQDPMVHGYLTGVVRQISRYALSELSLMETLANEFLAAKMSKAGPPYEILVAISRNPKDSSGYLWTSTSLEKRVADAGTLCEAHIILSKRAPITYLYE